MIEAKIVLLMFIWPAGQTDDRPLWISDAYLTVESCEEDAAIRKARVIAKYGADSRTEYFCIHRDDRLDP
ncbi:hypothetical protein [Sphingorhabdus sp. SMR4y]|uniref:hypothetical protein n=1 Tax=Sphingorhabdus sp. SMR4y TaxID=2584094 RepID=UPI000B5C89A5|nr:hypothetical protein [Sphingorhabdus sp. SMR4y]ASK88010.1 hypothetical protein SPHFLASMR4Y_01244 [Sphingorhabdus sp. SMR4y]